MTREERDAELDALFVEKQRQENLDRELGLRCKELAIDEDSYRRSQREAFESGQRAYINANAEHVRHNEWLRSDAHWLRVFTAAALQGGQGNMAVDFAAVAVAAIKKREGR